MTVNDILVMVRQRIGDMNKLTFSDAELLYCLNNAMDELCIELADQLSPEILKELKVQDSETKSFKLPDDFIAWQGQYPLNYVTDADNQTNVTLTGPNWDGDTPTLKYFASKTHFTALSQTVPFRTLTQQQRLMKLCVQQIKGGTNNESQGTSKSGSSTGQA